MSVVKFDRKGLFAFFFVFAILSLVGCSDDDDEADNTPPDTSAPVISNLSHADLEKVIGDRAITFTADVTDDVGATVTITHNGNPVTVTPSGDTYTASITLEDRDNNVIEVTASDADNTTTDSVTLNYPFLAFTNGQAASVVIGQPDFDSTDYKQGGATAANTLANGKSVTYIEGRVYISDDDNRVLGFNSVPTVNNANADFVIGQNDFTSNTSGETSTTLSSPSGIAYENNHFFILNGGLDTRANHWNQLITDNSVAADFVVGQADFGTGVNFTCAQDTLYLNSTTMSVVNGKIVISDYRRVLIWNSIPTTSGANADLVLGQQNFINCAANDQDGDGNADTPSAQTLGGFTTVWSDGTRLVVSDSANNRVLIWNSFPTTNAQAADLVLGQADFVSAVTPTTTANSLTPGVVVSNGNQLFIADNIRDRVMIWDSWPTANNQPADRVLGANDFVGDITGLTNASLFAGAESLAVTENHLLLLHSTGSRVFVFNAP